jgi:hypothetical protein
MSKIDELLRAKRLQQIAKMEGRPVDPAALHSTDSKLAAVQRSLRKSAKNASRKSKRALAEVRKSDRGLYICPHAWKRMHQRSITIKHVYAMWVHGTPKTLHDSSRTAHVITHEALEHAPSSIRALFKDFMGAAIIIETPSSEEERPCVVTVLADGEDTRFS